VTPSRLQALVRAGRAALAGAAAVAVLLSAGEAVAMKAKAEATESAPAPAPAARPRGETGLAASVRRALGLEPAARTTAAKPVAEGARDEAMRHLRRGNGLVERRRFEEAAEAYLEAVAVDPTLAAGWNNLGTLVRRAGKWSDARRLFEHAIKLEPANALAHYNLGMVHEHDKRYSRADEEYLKALDLDPTLWVPTRNPQLVASARSDIALRALYRKTEGPFGLTMDDGTHAPSAPATRP
jgi:tetratricopeptide (TPR) repeat protein